MDHRIRNSIIGGSIGLGVGIALALFYDRYATGKLKRTIAELDNDIWLGGEAYLPQYAAQSPLRGLPAAGREDRHEYRQRL